MTVIVTDKGFANEDWTAGFADLEDAANDTRALTLGPETDPAGVPLRPGLEMIRVLFPSFADGRGFTIARQLRLRGYRGRLRAAGYVLSDQYAMARRCGFDEVEISEGLATRQPEAEWRFRADWQAHDHRTRLRG